MSNDTHRLTDLAVWVLDLLTFAGTLWAHEIAARTSYDTAELEDVLEELMQLGLIVRC